MLLLYKNKDLCIDMSQQANYTDNLFYREVENNISELDSSTCEYSSRVENDRSIYIPNTSLSSFHSSQFPTDLTMVQNPVSKNS